MNRTAFAARLTTDELAAEIEMYEVEMIEYRQDLENWRGYDMLQALRAEAETRRAAALAEFDAWLWSPLLDTEEQAAESAALADMQHYGWEDGRPVEYQQVAA